ncbi:tRNA lysidine(34) synthetase TilS [Spirosoma fluviale]|uniref:tRNA(Ile)-lysidine synthase n=1 Tax=Spirosoma fluviale TaxID=1597977 RepID=A0A286FA78_9BACT|nr:tRNA lysidine(34) synthetase TilS [Spirosoma fluviale]SOD80148.1 tRNA(Ile)-lysidine synthase [Spirosoma fluviale]
MIEEGFLGFINDNQLFKPSDRVLLAVSGGIDSIVMAELFYRSGQPFAIAHVNFSMRGAASEADAVFVQNKAESYGVPFHLIRFDTQAIARERGISIQMAARELRYDWFAQLLSEFSYACLATAHHKNDILETLLLNLTRGTGIAGLHGILPRQNQVVRPLLFATRDQITAYAASNNLDYREDSSNADTKYARNRIRHLVVPVLTDLNPGLWQTLPRTVERLRAAETLMRAELDRSWQAIADVQGSAILLPRNKLLAQSELPFRLMEWLKPFGFTNDQAPLLVTSLAQPVGQVFQSATHRIIHERNGLLLEAITPSGEFEIQLTNWPDTPISIGDRYTLTTNVFERPIDFAIPTAPEVACLDVDRLTFPLTIRLWKQGDKIRPIGLNGHKLVSDLLNDLKLSRSEREQTAVLLSGNEIVWVIGRRIAHSFRITSKTRRIGKFTWSLK